MRFKCAAKITRTSEFLHFKYILEYENYILEIEKISWSKRQRNRVFNCVLMRVCDQTPTKAASELDFWKVEYGGGGYKSMVI